MNTSPTTVQLTTADTLRWADSSATASPGSVRRFVAAVRQFRADRVALARLRSRRYTQQYTRSGPATGASEHTLGQHPTASLRLH